MTENNFGRAMVAAFAQPDLTAKLDQLGKISVYGGETITTEEVAMHRRALQREPVTPPPDFTIEGFGAD